MMLKKKVTPQVQALLAAALDLAGREAIDRRDLQRARVDDIDLAGAAARQSIGTGVLGGMLAATFLAVFLVPLFFKLVNDWNFRSTPDDYKFLNKPAHGPKSPIHHAAEGEGAAHV